MECGFVVCVEITAKSNYDHCYYNHRPFELEMKQIHEHFKEDTNVGKYFIIS